MLAVAASFVAASPLMPADLRELAEQNHMVLVPAETHKDGSAIKVAELKDGCCTLESFSKFKVTDPKMYFSSFNVISLGGGYKDTKKRLTDGGVPDTMVHMWMGANGNEQAEKEDPGIKHKGESLGVYQPDEGCNKDGSNKIEVRGGVAVTDKPAPKPAAKDDDDSKDDDKGGDVVVSKKALKSKKSMHATSHTKKDSHAKAKASKGGKLLDYSKHAEELDLWAMDAEDIELTMADPTVCMAKASFGWHQWGISVSHASAWQMASKAPAGKWTVIMEEDAGFATAKGGADWYKMANWLIDSAPSDAEFVWLSGQTPMVRGVGPTRQATAKDPLYIPGATFCPHTYAITPGGAQKMLQAGHKYGVYGAVDIFMIQKMDEFINSYMVNGLYMAAKGIMNPNPNEFFPRNSGIGWQIFEKRKKTPPSAMLMAKASAMLMANNTHHELPHELTWD